MLAYRRWLDWGKRLQASCLVANPFFVDPECSAFYGSDKRWPPSDGNHGKDIVNQKAAPKSAWIIATFCAYVLDLGPWTLDVISLVVSSSKCQRILEVRTQATCHTTSDRHSWPLYAQSALLCTFSHTPSFLKLLWPEWFRMTPIQNSTTVAGVFWNPDINPDVFMFIFYHFCQFWLWLRDYIHCKASNFATRPWKLATWLSKAFSTNLVPVALRCPISLDICSGFLSQRVPFKGFAWFYILFRR